MPGTCREYRRYRHFAGSVIRPLPPSLAPFFELWIVDLENEAA